MLVRRERGTRAEVELCNGHAHAGQSRPGGWVGVADGARVVAVLILRVGGEVVFPLVAWGRGDDVPAVEHGGSEEELVVEAGVGVVVDGKG